MPITAVKHGSRNFALEVPEMAALSGLSTSTACEIMLSPVSEEFGIVTGDRSPPQRPPLERPITVANYGNLARFL